MSLRWKKVKFATIWLHNTVIIPTGWDKRFWNCDHPDVHSGDQRRSIFPWGTRMRIEFTREKITLPTPQCRLILVSKISEQRLRFWVSFVCQVQKAIQHFTLKCEMLSQNNASFLWYGTGGSGKSDVLLILKSRAGSREILLLIWAFP